MITAGGGLPMRFRKIRSNKRRLCLRKTTLLMLIIILGLPAGELPALAHHSFAAVFDMQGAPVKVTGTVTRFDVVTVEGPRAKDGTNFGMGRTWTLPDGRQVFGNNPDAVR